MRLSAIIARAESLIAESHIDVHAKAAYHGVVEGAKAGYVAAKAVGTSTYANEVAIALPDWKLENAVNVARERGNEDVALIFEAELRRRTAVVEEPKKEAAVKPASRKPAGKARVTSTVATAH